MKMQFFWKCSAMSTDKQLLTLQMSTVPPPKDFHLHRQHCENLKSNTDTTYSYFSSLPVASYEDNVIHDRCMASKWYGKYNLFSQSQETEFHAAPLQKMWHIT
jgi:hypothetical protein